MSLNHIDLQFFGPTNTCPKCGGMYIGERGCPHCIEINKDQTIADLSEENRRLREALVPAMEWVRQNGVDGNIGMLDAFAAAEIIRGLATELIGSAHNFQEIYNVQNRPPSAAE